MIKFIKLGFIFLFYATIKIIFKEATMKTIAEQIVDCYKEINKSGKPVTLEWLRRQRIVKGRTYLDIQFGHDVVNNILGELTFLAKADELLTEVEYASKYQLLPQIANFLSYECDTVLDVDNPIREKYSSLQYRITIPFYCDSKPNEEISFMDILNVKEKYIPTDLLSKFHYSYENTFKTDPCRCFFYQYLQNVSFYSLKLAFEEIRAEVEK